MAEETPARRSQGFQSGYLAQNMGLVGIVLSGLFFVTLAVGTVQVLVGVWPGQEGAIRFLWFSFGETVTASVDTRLFLTALFAGVLGSFIHTATSFSVYLGNRQLKRSWVGWYLLRPFIGSALGVLFYFLIRAGFMSPGAGDGAGLNPYGIAALAGLAGMFSKEAADKLQQVFQDMLKPPPHAEQERGDKLKAED